ncbi:cyclase family protein [Terricaulis silvestris]|uniref:Kynurenine formamidase n=1 Tax=Terricaulis silvestris TaxID=2686094 RepID=A0A6I6MSY7_9CAUL|nr:cyclase family protein [Terricaulis silvestris]QGZ96458.1 Kynurenine formamidase [Terricaulis silvestris]
MSHFVDLSHHIEHGMETFKGLPGPVICDYWTREASEANYEDGSSFSIGRIDMVANTGTYVDAPFHRYADGRDLAHLPLASIAELDGLMVRNPHENGLATTPEHFAGLDVRGKAVLIATGWDAHWRTPPYFSDHSFLTEEAARYLADNGAAFVGIDSHNIDDTRTKRRPVHTILLAADIPIGEHLTRLNDLPPQGFTFHAAPPPVVGMGTFPVRAYAVLR